MLTTLNPLNIENVFNSRFPKIFIDRIAYEESINETNEENSSFTFAISTHMFDFKNVDQRFNLLEDQELLSELVVNFLFTTTEEYDELNSDEYFKLSNEWLKGTANYHKFSMSLLEMLAFDLNEKEKLPKSILFESSEFNVHTVPLKTMDLTVPVVFKDNELSQQRLKLFVYFSLDEDSLLLDKISSNKGLLSAFFGGVNEVQIIEDSRLNNPRLVFFNPETEKYWQKEAIYTSTDIPKAVSDFTPSEIASNYLSLVRSIKNDMNVFVRRDQADFIANITTPFYTTKKDSHFVKDVALKIENLLVDNVGNSFRTAIVRRLVNFISGVDTQLENYPTLELRQIGDGRIQRKTISFLEQANVGRTTPEVNEIKDYFESSLRSKRFCVSDLFFASDDDGSVEAYCVLNKTNMMRIFSPFYTYFPNFETLLPEAKSLFTIQEVSVTRDHAYSSSPYNPDIMSAPLPENAQLPIGRFLFSFNEQSERLNDFQSFEGTFTGRRERTVLQVQDTETTTLEGVEGESETSTTTIDRDIIEEVYETVDAITTGVAARLYTPNQDKDELILFSVNDQSINASEEISTSGLIVRADDPLDEEDGNLNLFLHYRFSAKYIDRTGVFLLEQLKYLTSTIAELEAYLEEAAEKCAFNDITDVFNDYFIDQQYRKYPDIVKAPWNKVSAILSYQMAIFNRVLLTDQEDIKRNAVEIKKLLDPKTATLDSIQVVLSAANVFRLNLRSVLISIGAINPVPGTKGIVDNSLEVKDEIEIVGTPALTDWFVPRLSQYTGVQRLETIEETVDNRVRPLPTPDDAVGIFVQAFAPKFKSWYNDLPTSTASGASPFLKFLTVAKYIVRNSGTFGLSDPLPGKGQLKLRFIRPWRNRSGRSSWKNKSVTVTLNSQTQKEYEDGGNLVISMSDFDNDSYRLANDVATANRALQRLCHVMMTAETLIGDFGGSSDEIRMIRPLQDRESDMYFHDDGYGGNSDQHLIFYKGNTKCQVKASHSDYISDNAKDVLNSKVFKNSKSGVADRDGLVWKNKNDGEISRNTIRDSFFAPLSIEYLKTIREVYDGFIIDGEDIIPDIDFMITRDKFDDQQETANDIFKKVYNSGFFPWPGYPNIPTSLGTTKDELFG